MKLNATVYTPREQKEPAPCVVTLTPYVAQSYHDRGMYFAAHGHPFLTVDVRGRGNSEGQFRPLIITSRLSRKGSRLRLTIEAINSLHSQKNYNSCGDVSSETLRDARPVTVKLYHDRAHPSALYVPIGQLGRD